MSNSAIAGRRRSGPPPLPAAEAAPSARAAPSSLAAGATRVLPPLDYDEPTPPSGPRGVARGARVQAQEVTRPGKRRQVGRVRWFVLGIAVGAVAAAALGGGGSATRAWIAGSLRSFAHRGAASSPAATAMMANVSISHMVRSRWTPADGPCPVDPGPDDPCAELLAPFASGGASAANVPTVSVDDLPRVVPPVVVARRRPHAAPTPATAASETATTGDPPAAGLGVNPDEDPSAPPAKAAPTPVPAPTDHPADPPSSAQPSALNEPT